MYKVFRNGLGVVDAINRLDTGASVPLPLENNASHPLVKELRAWEALNGALNLSVVLPTAISLLGDIISLGSGGSNSNPSAATTGTGFYSGVVQPLAPNYYCGLTKPVGPTVGSTWEELDSNGNLEASWFFNGTYWLSKQIYSAGSTFNFLVGNQNIYLPGRTRVGTSLGFGGSNSVRSRFVLDFRGSILVFAPLNLQHYWAFAFQKKNATNTITSDLYSYHTVLSNPLNDASKWIHFEQPLNIFQDTKDIHMYSLAVVRNGNPGALLGNMEVRYREVC